MTDYSKWNRFNSDQAEKILDQSTEDADHRAAVAKISNSRAKESKNAEEVTRLASEFMKSRAAVEALKASGFTIPKLRQKRL